MAVFTTEIKSFQTKTNRAQQAKDLISVIYKATIARLLHDVTSLLLNQRCEQNFQRDLLSEILSFQSC